MNTFRKILVPVDFSEHSDLALQTAVGLARTHEGALTLVYVYEQLALAVPEGYVLFSEAQLERMFEEFRRSLSKQKQVAEAAGASRVEVQLLHGFASGEVCSFAEQGAFDLIVMGTHGRRGLSHAFLGSVAERVVRMAPCPVLTVRAKAGGATRECDTRPRRRGSASFLPTAPLGSIAPVEPSDKSHPALMLS